MFFFNYIAVSNIKIKYLSKACRFTTEYGILQFPLFSADVS